MGIPYSGADQIFRDFEGSAAHRPDKTQIRAWGQYLESAHRHRFNTVSALTADSALTLTTDQAGTVAAGDLVAAGDMTYEVALGTATDHHVTTAGGVKLYEAGTKYTTRARLAEFIARGNTPEDGVTYTAGRLSFEGSTGATDISDMGGLIPQDIEIEPDHFADNTTPGTTDRQAATQAAVTYLGTIGGGILRFKPGTTHHFGTSVTVSASNIYIHAHGAKITADDQLGDETQNQPDGVFNFIGTQASSTSLASNAAENATTITVASATGIAAGQAIRLYNALSGVGSVWYTDGGTSVFRHFITKVVGVSGTTITLADPLPFAFDATTYTCVVLTWDGVKNCGIEGGDWDGGGYSKNLVNGVGTALAYSIFCQNLSIKPEIVRGFSGAQVWASYTLGLEFDCTFMEGHRDSYTDAIVEGTNSGFYGLRMDDCANCVVGSFSANRTRHALDGTRTWNVVTGDIVASNSHRTAFGTHNGCSNWQHGKLSSRGPNGAVLWRGFDVSIDGLYVDAPNDSEPAFYDTAGASGDLKRTYQLNNFFTKMGRESIRLEADIDTCIINGGKHVGAIESASYSVIVVNSPRLKTFQMNGGVVEGATARLADFASGATERDNISFNGTEFRDYTIAAVRCEAVTNETTLTATGIYLAPNGGTAHVDANGTYDNLLRQGFVQGGDHYQPDSEGSVTPTLGDGSTNCTLSSQSVVDWRKDGARVTLSGEVRLTDVNGVTGNIELGNLPFDIATDGGGIVVWASGFDAATSTNIKLRALTGGTVMGLFHDGVGSDANVVGADLENSTRFNFIATYTTSD